MTPEIFVKNYRLSHNKFNFLLKITKENQNFCLPNYAILCNYRLYAKIEKESDA